MTLLERVREAVGGARWARLQHFTSHLMLGGSLVASLEDAYSLKEILVEGDVVSRSIRMSGLSGVRGAWGFHPNFVTIQHDDGAFVGAGREAAPRPFRSRKDVPELVYLCGLGVWTSLTTPLALFEEGVLTEELGAWPERGQTWWRLKVRTPVGALAYASESVMYFGEDGLLRRTDFDIDCGRVVSIVAYSSAHQSFSGLTVPTLHRAMRRLAPGGALERGALFDIEIFDAAFD